MERQNHGPFSYTDRQTVRKKGRGKRRSCPDGGWEGLVEVRADVVTLAELETQSRAVSRRQYESKKSLVSVGGVDGVWVGQT